MTTLVLVHGAWHGPWCWERLIRELTERGHRSIAVEKVAPRERLGIEPVLLPGSHGL